MDQRYVSGITKRGQFQHAVLVRDNGEYQNQVAACGAKVPFVTAGPNHGHDWDRVHSHQQCGKCRYQISLEEKRDALRPG